MGAVHWVRFTNVNDAVLLALFTMMLPMVMVPLFTSASNWLAEREQEAGFCDTAIVAEELLFAGFGSVVLAEIVAVFVTALVALAFTSVAMSSVAVAFGKSVPIVHVPVELAYEVLAEAVAFSNVSPTGRMSAATTSVDVVEVLLLIAVSA
jgi:hypothetical protein